MRIMKTFVSCVVVGVLGPRTALRTERDGFMMFIVACRKQALVLRRFAEARAS